MGAEAIKELLRRVRVEELALEMRARMKTETSAQKKLKFAKRLKVVDAFRRSGNKPEWMILDVIPVIPPELRPLVPLDGDASRPRTSTTSTAGSSPEQPAEEAPGAARP